MFVQRITPVQVFPYKSGLFLFNVYLISRISNHVIHSFINTFYENAFVLLQPRLFKSILNKQTEQSKIMMIIIIIIIIIIKK